MGACMAWYHDEAALRTAVAEHGSVAALAKASGVPRQTLQTWTSRHGIHSHHPSSPTNPPTPSHAPSDAPPMPPADPAEVVALRQRVARAEDRARTAERQLSAGITSTNLLEDVRALAQPILQDYRWAALDPVVQLARRPRRTEPVELVVYLSDWHIGEVIHAADVQGHNEYGPQVAAERLQHAAGVLADWVENYAAMHRIGRIVFALMGDMVNNAGLLHSDQSTDYARVLAQALDASLLARQMIQPFTGLKGVTVSVVTTQGGNHGRSTRKMPSGPAAAQTSWDQVMYEHLAAMMTGSGVEFTIGRSYSTTIDVAGQTMWLAHGDAIKGGGGSLGIPAYGTKRASDAAVMASVVDAIRKSSSGKIVQHARVGHFHQEVQMGMPTGTFKIVPSIKGTGAWELSALGKTSNPEMLFEVFHPAHGLIGSHTIDCAAPAGSGFTWGAMRSTTPAAELL